MFNTKRFCKLFLTAALCAGATFALSGCGGGEQSAPEKPAAEQSAQAIRVGSSIDFAPFEFQDENDKNAQGFDVDLIQAVGKELGREVEISNVDFDELIPELEAKNIDVAISAISINDERKGKVNFSDAYYNAGMSIVVKSDNTDINSINDLEGKRIAVMKDTLAVDRAKQIANAQVKESETPLSCLNELINGEADAVINDKPVNDYCIMNNSLEGLKSLPEQLDVSDYGIAVAKDNEQLLKDINESLKKLKSGGEYDKIHEKWFGKESK